METLIEYDKSVYDMSDAEIAQVVDLLFSKITTHPYGYSESALPYLENNREKFVELILNCSHKTLYFNNDIFTFNHIREPDGLCLEFKENGVTVQWNPDEKWMI